MCFNLSALALDGPAIAVLPGVAAVSVSETGVLVTSAPGTKPRTIPAWFDRTGAVLGRVGESGFFESVALSADGRKLALADGAGGVGVEGANDIWSATSPAACGHDLRSTP